MRNRVSREEDAADCVVRSGLAPLSEFAAGERGVVAELRAGHSVLGRMVALGFTPGAPVVVVQNFGRGPIIVLVRDARIALGRGEAGRVLVRRERS